jgi:hypothetical protein
VSGWQYVPLAALVIIGYTAAGLAIVSRAYPHDEAPQQGDAMVGALIGGAWPLLSLWYLISRAIQLTRRRFTKRDEPPSNPAEGG